MLQSHQNKFHVAALRSLTERFAAFRSTDDISAADRELFAYFADLYKNSNRGIKGRGKDRKIAGAGAGAAAGGAGALKKVEKQEMVQRHEEDTPWGVQEEEGMGMEGGGGGGGGYEHGLPPMREGMGRRYA